MRLAAFTSVERTPGFPIAARAVGTGRAYLNPFFLSDKWFIDDSQRQLMRLFSGINHTTSGALL